MRTILSRKVQLTLPFDCDLEKEVRSRFPSLIDYRIISESLDARSANKGRVPKKNFQLELKESESDQFSTFSESFIDLSAEAKRKGFMPIIIGAGPAGLFAALRFSEYGIPCRLFERGSRAHERMKSIAKFWRYGELDSDDNVCFGEGGAGLYSDGKLITRIKSPYVSYVMQRFVDFGAPAQTAYLSNPHLGSNKIRGLINKMTDHLKSRGCQFHYNTRIEDFLFDNAIRSRKIVGVKTSQGEDFYSDQVILATGHSAKEVYHQLKYHDVAMRAKDFAVGVRIEHPRKVIDKIQYGKFVSDDLLGAARYRLSFYDQKTETGIFSFCMCPGGYVLSSGTDPDGIVVNGMSNYSRSSPWSNSALVVSVKSGSDFCNKDVLSGLEFQNKIEKEAYQLSFCESTGRELPAQRVWDFIDNKKSTTLPKTSSPSKIFSANLRSLFPDFIVENLIKGLHDFDQKMPGFLDHDAVLIAPETRTSSPITILRDKESLESTSHEGLYPCGEGAGYAGGITSAAVDGINVTTAIMKKYFSSSMKD